MYVVYLMNRVPSSVLHFKTPFEKLSAYGNIPSNLTLTPRVFGCVAFVHLHKHQRTKLDPCALKCVFVEYLPHKKGYKCYHPPTRQFYVTMDVTFSEAEMYFSRPTSTSSLQGEMSVEEPNWMIVLPDVNMAFPSQESSDYTGLDLTTPEYDTTNLVTLQSPTRPLSLPTVPTNDLPSVDVHEVCIDFGVNTNNLINDHVSLVSSDGSRYQLPPRSNRGKPPERFT